MQVESTPIPGLLVVHLDVHADARGWFKEDWQRAKLRELGIRDLGPVQHNVAFNTHRGSTRGIHAEPWDKYISVSAGKVFAAWVDLRQGPTFGVSHYRELDESVAVVVPRGVGNSYQTLVEGVSYTYLVTDHWRGGHRYPAVRLDDPALDIPWPIPLDEAEISAKDLDNPSLDDVTPMPPRRTLVLGADGQLGRSLLAAFPEADGTNKAKLDLTDEAAVLAWPWSDYDVVLNAAAYTAVDDAETNPGRLEAWAVNAGAVARLAAMATEHNFHLVHFSTEYVFDGDQPEHEETEPLSPLGVYAQTKAAGDLAATAAPKHYLLRTSWLVGEGRNFVRTMRKLALDGVSPGVVDDQLGRLTFADELTRAVRHLLDVDADPGVYHVSNGGPAMSWCDVARLVFEANGRAADAVRPVSTADYVAGRAGAVTAPRPRNSSFDLTKLRATGFEPEDAATALASYLAVEPA